MNRKNIKSMKGFTLLELIVVIAIIAILAVIAIPSFTKSIKTARINAIKADITNLRKAMEIYYYNNGGKYNNQSAPANTQGDCVSGTWNNTVFADPVVSKIMLSLKNKLYPGGNWASFYNGGGGGSFGNIFYCGLGRDMTTFVIVLWNIDKTGLGVCLDSAGFYNGKDYSIIPSGSTFTTWTKCFSSAISAPFTFPEE